MAASKKWLIGLFFIGTAFSCTFSCADDIQRVLRYFGTGWGAGYHAYRPTGDQVFGCSGSRTSRHCLDQYSKINQSWNYSRSCFNYGNGCHSGSPYSPMALQTASPQFPYGQNVQVPHPNDFPPFMQRSNRTLTNPSRPFIRNQPSPPLYTSPINTSPLKSSSIRNDETALPPLEENPLQRLNVPADAGTTGNPFGIPAQPVPMKQTAPNSNQPQVVPIRPGVSDFSRTYRPGGGRGRRPLANSNTFNGIR